MDHLCSHPVEELYAPMTRASRDRRGRAGRLLAASLCLAGCAPATLEIEFVHDPQTCAEDALRRRPDPALAAETAAAFSSDCARGDTASCSMLGVAHEVGYGVARDADRARSLYQQACRSGNKRACGNLGEVLLAEAEPGASPAAPLTLLEVACEAKQGRACAVLGHALAHSAVVPRDLPLAGRFLRQACDREQPHACLELAELVEGGSVPARPGMAEHLLEIACARGSEVACDRLAPAPRSRGTAAR